MKTRFIYMVSLVYLATIFTVNLTQSVAIGQISDDPSRPTIGQSGKIFTIQLTPKSKRLQVGVTGKQVLSIDPNEIIVAGKSYPKNGAPRVMSIVPVDGNAYEVKDSLDDVKHVEIEIKDKKSKKSETFKIETSPRR